MGYTKLAHMKKTALSRSHTTTNTYRKAGPSLSNIHKTSSSEPDTTWDPFATISAENTAKTQGDHTTMRSFSAKTGWTKSRTREQKPDTKRIRVSDWNKYGAWDNVSQQQLPLTQSPTSPGTALKSETDDKRNHTTADTTNTGRATISNPNSET